MASRFSQVDILELAKIAIPIIGGDLMLRFREVEKFHEVDIDQQEQENPAMSIKPSEIDFDVDEFWREEFRKAIEEAK